MVMRQSQVGRVARGNDRQRNYRGTCYSRDLLRAVVLAVLDPVHGVAELVQHALDPVETLDQVVHRGSEGETHKVVARRGRQVAAVGRIDVEESVNRQS